MAWFGRGPPMAMPMGVPAMVGVPMPMGVPQMQQQQHQQQGAVDNMPRKRVSCCFITSCSEFNLDLIR